MLKESRKKRKRKEWRSGSAYLHSGAALPTGQRDFRNQHYLPGQQRGPPAHAHPVSGPQIKHPHPQTVSRTAGWCPKVMWGGLRQCSRGLILLYPTRFANLGPWLCNLDLNPASGPLNLLCRSGPSAAAWKIEFSSLELLPVPCGHQNGHYYVHLSSQQPWELGFEGPAL